MTKKINLDCHQEGLQMGRIVVFENVTLDGVMQAPARQNSKTHRMRIGRSRSGSTMLVDGRTIHSPTAAIRGNRLIANRRDLRRYPKPYTAMRP